MNKLVYLSLGSNIGNRLENIDNAIGLLQDSQFVLLRRSPLYETEPRDMPNQPWFLNLVIEGESELFPRQLLGRIKKIEKQLGRKRIIDKGPRTIDIDILMYGRFILDTPDLTVPHPRMHERRFVLEPLKDLAADLRHPVIRKTVAELLADVKSQKLRRVES